MSEHLFSGCLLVSDIDGTLLDTHKQIPAANRDAIRTFMAEGGVFTLASGRSVHSVRRIAEQVLPNGPVILLNGTQLYDLATDRVLAQTDLPPAYRSVVADILVRFPSIGIQLYRDDRILSVRMNAVTQRMLAIEGISETPIGDGDMPLQINKLLFAAEPDQLRPLADYLQSIPLPGMCGLYSEACYYELLPAGVSKGTALKQLAAHLRIPMAQTAAIGDYYNDADMLQAAALSFIPANAPADMAPYARQRVCHCDDGAVAAAVETLRTWRRSRAEEGC